MQYFKGSVLVGLHMVPLAFAWWARGLFDEGASVQPALLIVFACLCVAATLFRGLHIEERNEDLETYAPTPLWPKRLPRWARDTLPPTAPPPLRLAPTEEPVTSTRMRAIEWPGQVQRTNPANDDGETTESDTLAS